MKLKFLKTLILITAFVLSLYNASFTANAEGAEISKELAADIITRTEEAYDALDIMRYDFDNDPALNSRIKEIPYEVRTENGYEHYDHMNWVFETEHKSREGWLEFLRRTFTEEMAEIIINESELIFKDGKAYLPTDPSQLMDNVIALHEQERTAPLTERISKIVSDGSDEYTITYLGWSKLNQEKYKTEQDENGRIVIVGEPEILSIKVRKEGADYKVCDYDGVFFIKNDNSRLSASGMRPYRFVEENPQSGDFPVYITAAAGMIALCCAVICKKKIKT